MVKRKALAEDYWRDEATADDAQKIQEIRAGKIEKAAEQVSTELDR